MQLTNHSYTCKHPTLQEIHLALKAEFSSVQRKGGASGIEVKNGKLIGKNAEGFIYRFMLSPNKDEHPEADKPTQFKVHGEFK